MPAMESNEIDLRKCFGVPFAELAVEIKFHGLKLKRERKTYMKLIENRLRFGVVCWHKCVLAHCYSLVLNDVFQLSEPAETDSR